MSLTCADSAGPVTFSPSNGTPFNLNEEMVNINGSMVGTGIYTGGWTPGATLPNQITFSSPAGSETFYAPTVVSITPTAYTLNIAQTFTAVYSDSNGASDMTDAWIALSNGTGANSIMVNYNAKANTLTLYDNDGSTIKGSCAPGAAVTISNSQGSLNCGQTTVPTSGGNNLTVNWNITPSVALKYIYVLASDALGMNTGALSPPAAVSLTPSPLRNGMHGFSKY